MRRSDKEITDHEEVEEILSNALVGRLGVVFLFCKLGWGGVWQPARTCPNRYRRVGTRPRQKDIVGLANGARPAMPFGRVDGRAGGYAHT